MKRSKTFTEWLAVACIFSVFLDKALRGILPFDFYYYYPIFILFLISLFLQTGKITSPPRWFITGTLIIFVFGFFITWYKDLLGFEFIKQVFGIVFTSLVYYNALYILKFDIKKIFNYYLLFAFWVALHGVIDNLLHYAGVHLTTVNLTGGLYREYGIMGEPFYLAIALTPAIVYYLCYFNTAWRNAKFRFLTTILCYLLTYSSIAILGFVLGVFFALYINDFFNTRKGKLILVPVVIAPVIFFVSFLVDNISLINARFYDTTSLFLSSEIKAKEAGKSNSSTFALYSNYAIARDSFIESPLFGSGLGSHPLIYKETFLKYFPSNYLLIYGAQNQQDANSKFLRLMSETGLVGLMLFIYAFIHFFAPKRKMNSPTLKNLGAINYSIFVYIMLCVIRNGNYINIGFFLFFFIYYMTWSKIAKSSVKLPAKQKPTIAA
ncbi:hypothetical protein DC498_11630 [Terrimonas sp.]|uniref:O-antigen ligase family protein n=1 Tax=Terrimonas sp. TaxID=1914338 RepID=UPI000D51250E|nr:O-antigen ligase family protein [Terrimonas sp.]PVD52033.1 hypothetical protein DC498_11630 [Terrimonas sp.]